jgi:hypothetical protein
MQGVAHDHYDVRFDCVKALSQTPDGDEIAANPGDELKLEEDEDEEDDQDDVIDENEEDTDPADEDPAESGDDHGPNDIGDGKNGDEGIADLELDNPSTRKVVADLKYLQSVNHALGANDKQRLKQILRAGPAAFLAPPPQGTYNRSRCERPPTSRQSEETLGT